jgi:hypothetical protein
MHGPTSQPLGSCSQGRVLLKLIHPMRLRGGEGGGQSFVDGWGWGSNQLHWQRTVLDKGRADSALNDLATWGGERGCDAFATLQINPIPVK